MPEHMELSIIFLLRDSPMFMCYTDEDMMEYDDAGFEDLVEECNLDGEGYKFFSKAAEMYGKRLGWCLVDRGIGREENKQSEIRPEHNQYYTLLVQL